MAKRRKKTSKKRHGKKGGAAKTKISTAIKLLQSAKKAC